MSLLGHNNPPSNGWIAIDRGVLEHQIVGAGKPVKPAEKDKPAYTKLEAWFDILRITSYKPQTVNNVGQKMTLNRGDFMGAIRFLGVRWNWTKRTVEGFLKKLEENGMLTNVTPQNDKNGSYKTGVYRVENYNKYQSFDTNDGTPGNSLSDCNLTINSSSAEVGGDRSGTPQGTPSVTDAGTPLDCSSDCNIMKKSTARHRLGDTHSDSKGDTFGDKYNNNKQIKTKAKALAKNDENFDEKVFKKENLTTDQLLRKKVGGRLPEDWKPTEEDLQWAEADLVLTPEQVRFETDNFVDYWLASSGAKATKLDWSRSWKTWLRKAHKDQERRNENIKLNEKRFGKNKNSSDRDKIKAILGNPKFDKFKAPPPTMQYTKEFNAFWDLCPKKINEEGARDEFVRITNGREGKQKADPDTLIEGMRLYAKYNKDTDFKFLLTPENWLLKKRWTDEYDGEKIKVWGWWRGRDWGYLTPEDWRGVLRKSNSNNVWEWRKMGPPPGHPECVIPKALTEPLIDRYADLTNSLMDKYGVEKEAQTEQGGNLG